MNSTISQTIWHGVNAWKLENENLITVIVPEMGAKLVSLFDKRSQREWLVGPGNRPFQKVPYGSPFTEQDMSGWDEMFPTIVACDYPAPGVHHGLSLPDHGEVWTLPWQVEQATDEKLTLSVNGPALPYRLTRTAEYTSPFVLQLSYQLINLGQETMPYLVVSPSAICMRTERRSYLSAAGHRGLQLPPRSLRLGHPRNPLRLEGSGQAKRRPRPH